MAVKTGKIKEKNKGRMLFFTGFPGFIGKKLAEKALIEDPSCRINFLVQEKYYSLAKEAMDNLRFQVPDIFDRCELVTGDITQPKLGMSESVRAKIESTTTEVWHLAAAYDLGIGLKTAYRINVDGTVRVMNLCERIKNLSQFVYFSTCYVSGDRTGLILEKELDCRQGFKNHYEATKFDAEVLVQKRWNEIPTIIFRPSIVVGDSISGEAEKADGPYAAIRLLAMLEAKEQLIPGLRIPFPGQGDAELNMVPVDYVAKVAWEIAKDQNNLGKVFALCDPNPLTSVQFFDMTLEAFGLGPSIKALPNPAADLLLVARKPLERLGFPIDSLIYTHHLSIYDERNTRSAIKQTGIQCPDIRSYHSRLIEFVRNHPGFAKKAKY